MELRVCFLGAFSPQNVYLLPQHPNFHLKRCLRPKQIYDHPNNEPDKISHPARASPDSRSTASQIEFAIGTRRYWLSLRPRLWPLPQSRLLMLLRAIIPAPAAIRTIRAMSMPRLESRLAPATGRPSASGTVMLGACAACASAADRVALSAQWEIAAMVRSTARARGWYGGGAVSQKPALPDSSGTRCDCDSGALRARASGYPQSMMDSALIGGAVVGR
jgi:hypothetical protein